MLYLLYRRNAELKSLTAVREYLQAHVKYAGLLGQEFYIRGGIEEFGALPTIPNVTLNVRGDRHHFVPLFINWEFCECYKKASLLLGGNTP